MTVEAVRHRVSAKGRKNAVLQPSKEDRDSAGVMRS
jgi:hypothetical protein